MLHFFYAIWQHLSQAIEKKATPSPRLSPPAKEAKERKNEIEKLWILFEIFIKEDTKKIIII